MTNRIIVPANYNFEVMIRLDTNNGRSELLIKNNSGKEISMLQVVGMLNEHSAYIIKEIVSKGKIKQTAVEVTDNAS